MKKIFLVAVIVTVAIFCTVKYVETKQAHTGVEENADTEQQVFHPEYKPEMQSRSLDDLRQADAYSGRERLHRNNNNNIEYFPAPVQNPRVDLVYYIPPKPKEINNENEAENNASEDVQNAPEPPKPFSAEEYLKENLPNRGGKIAINPTTPYSYKSRQEIFDIRKHYVEKSLFAYPGYEPSEYLTQIEDGKPWIEDSYCFPRNGTVPIGGNSEESRFLNNPSILVGVEGGNFLQDDKTKPYCSAAKLMPQSARYDAEKNEIEVVYKYVMTPPDNVKKHVSLNGLNANDLGYRFGYMDLSISSVPPEFDNPENISNTVIEFQNFVHTGGACGHAGGCNNGSPHQPPLYFNIVDKEHPSILYIKLWRNQPSSPYDEPDITEKMVFYK